METITPQYETLLLVSPFAVYPYPGHFLLPDANTAAALGHAYGGTPMQVKDPRLQFSSGLWQIMPNNSWWLAMDGGIGIECDQLAGYWTRMGSTHPETADLYCRNYIQACIQQGQKLPPKV